jgi:hypothetical protein
MASCRNYYVGVGNKESDVQATNTACKTIGEQMEKMTTYHKGPRNTKQYGSRANQCSYVSKNVASHGKPVIQSGFWILRTIHIP